MSATSEQVLISRQDTKIDVSVIVPTCNRADSLLSTLHSILNQDFPSDIRCEVLVIDNNSMDHTSTVVGRICGEHPHVVYLLEKEKGAARARNLGIRKARGNILLFVDDDAVIDNGWISTYWRLFENKSILVAQGRILMQQMPDETPSWFEFEGFRFFAHFSPSGDIPFADELVACNMAARKEVFELYGCFNPNLGPGTVAGFGEDTEFAERLQSFGVKIHYHRDAVVFHEVARARTTKACWRDRMFRYGYAIATKEVLVNWEKPHPRIRYMMKLARYYLKHMIARLSGNESCLLKYERRSLLRRGFLRGTIDAMRERRRMAKNSNSLSVCIITQDSAHCIGRAIKSVEDFCDEIIVVDGGSSDRTAEIAKSFSKVEYYLHPWTGNYVEQKNWAFNRAQGDWILSLDSDEVVGRNMQRRMLELMKSAKHSSYMFPRYWLVSESPPMYVHARKLYPDYQQRLFRNIPKYRYTQDRRVHHSFPEGVQGNAKKVKDTHFFHFDFIYCDRSEREEKAMRRAEMEPETSHINRNQYLYEGHPYKVKKCREKMW